MTLKQEMRLYREGLAPLPAAYITKHESAARCDLPRFLRSHALRLLCAHMEPDGWCDGMRVLNVDTVDDAGSFRTFVWSDANGGSWFEKGAGQSLVERAPNAPGHV
jgi:hypothetical protein